MHPDLILRIAGESGEGVITVGETLCRIAAREGIHIVTFRTFPAEIKGGACMIQVRLSEKPIPYHGEQVDFLVCLNQAAVDENLPDLREDGALLCETECDLSAEPGQTVYKVPFERIATREIGSRAKIGPARTSSFSAPCRTCWACLKAASKVLFPRNSREKAKRFWIIISTLYNEDVTLPRVICPKKTLTIFPKEASKRDF